MKEWPKCPVCNEDCPLDGKGGYLKTCGKRRCRGIVSKAKMPPDHFKKIGRISGIQSP